MLAVGLAIAGVSGAVWGIMCKYGPKMRKTDTLHPFIKNVTLVLIVHLGGCILHGD